MKPEKLILKGIYSYINETEIDFSILCEADLFGIFGNVGSGKSAVLEAITYVLYGKIERLSTRINYNMMNLMSDRMYIDFTFIQAGERYRFTFETKRNKKVFEKIETPQRGGYIEKEGEWIPLFDKDSAVSADEIIGLNYDNYRRTIIVPQGKFQEFLHLEKAKRTEMLMELFQLDRFDLYAGAASLAGQNSQKTAVAESRFSELSEVDAESLESAKVELADIDKQLLLLDSEIKASDKTLVRWGEIKRLHGDFTSTREKLELKFERSFEFKKRKEVLRRYEHCRELFRMEIGNLNEASRGLDTAVEKLLTVSGTLAAEKAAMEKVEKEFSEIESENLKIDEFRRQAGWYSVMLELKVQQQKADEMRELIKSERADLTGLQEKSSACAGELEQNRAELAGLASGPLTMDLMRKFSEAYASKIEHDESMRDEFENIKAAKCGIEDLNRQIPELSGWFELKSLDLFEEMPGTLFDAEEIVKIIDEAVSVSEGKFRKEILAASVSSEVKKIAESLEPGRACPVCGALEHPSPASGASGAEHALKAVEDDLGKQRDLLANLREGIAAFRNKESVLTGRIRSAEERAAAREERLRLLLENFPSGPFGPADYAAFYTARDKFIETDEKKQHLQQMISALNLEAEKCGSRLHEKKELIHEIEVRLAASEAGIAGKQDTIDNAFFESCRDRSASELSGALNKLETDIKRISAEYQRLEILKKGAGRVYENRLTEHSLLSISRDELYERREDQQKVLDLKIADSGYSGIDEISEILDLNIDPVLERSEIELFDRETDRLKIETARLELKLDGREYDEEKHRKAESENTGLKQRLTECAAASGEVRSLIADMTKRLNRKEELKIELDRLRIRGENINTLRNLFKGKKFIDYVATVYLRELCVAANSRFRKLTRESMRLELDEANNFIVRDYLNEGKIRSIKTLSGGQTFQAAFSLSLALADSIGKERSGFFFLDEGFGSLDRESLALVFESLKSLKKEDRTVGIISHVEELKQEIDTYITVCKDTEAGSLVTGSWDN